MELMILFTVYVKGATGYKRGSGGHSERMTSFRIVLYTEKANYKYTAFLSYTIQHDSL